MPDRLTVTKTYKLFIGGAFPRSESGRSLPITDRSGATIAHVSHSSRKDLRNAIVAARKVQPDWQARTAYNRGQILYRMAEMLEGKAEEFATALRATNATSSTPAARREVADSVDRLVAFAGWADKFQQVLGSHNAVAGPYHNFAIPEPTGVVVVVAPDGPALLALVSLIAAPVVAGNTVVAIGSVAHPLATAVLGEVLATSDLPGGVVNLLTAESHGELATHLAEHRDVNAISTATGEAGVDAETAKTLRAGAAENVKRVRTLEVSRERDWSNAERMCSPWLIEPFVETKALWHPAAT